MSAATAGAAGPTAEQSTRIAVTAAIDSAPTRNLQRKAAIAQGGIVDHSGYVIMTRDKNFDLDRTIFKNVQGRVNRAAQRRMLNRVPHWTSEAVERILREDAAVPAPPLVDHSITEFMLTECDFRAEHADGSFMDHVTFCHDYSAVHYPAMSPRVMLLHSIMGVGTNLFPMEASKIPKLAALISPEEMQHVEAFPSILRLILTQSLVDELWQRGQSVEQLKSIEFRRVIDNKELLLKADDLWAHLNYHLLHMVDFAPTEDWANGNAAPMFQMFVRLYRLLSRAGQLRAKVELHTAAGGRLTADDVEACARACENGMWHRFVMFKTKKGINSFSKDVGHSLKYKLNWNEPELKL